MVTKYKMYTAKYNQNDKDKNDLILLTKIIFVIGISGLICGSLS